MIEYETDMLFISVELYGIEIFDLLCIICKVFVIWHYLNNSDVILQQNQLYRY